jgi:ferredoxin
MALAIRVDRRACQGSRECVKRAPRTFSLDREGKAVVAEAPGDPDERIREAANDCPSFAIELTSVRPGRG